MRGERKVRIFCVAVGGLLAGLALCAVPSVAIAFPAFATALSAVTTAVVLGNVGEHFASKEKP